MTSLWVMFALGAAVMQTIRTAIQKHLKASLPTEVINWIRYAFGLPFALLYLYGLIAYGYNLPEWHIPFIIYCLVGGLAQIIATSLLINLFSHRNFAVGTTYAKTEALQTALLGIVFFGEYLSIGGTIAILMGVIGVIFISLIEEHISLRRILRNLTHRVALMGLASGAGFSLSGLCIRQAALSVDSGAPLMNASLTLVTMLAMQVVLLGLWILLKQPKPLAGLVTYWKSATMVGLTSCLGSIGWFTAFALTQAAYVKAVGQIELILSLLVAHRFFKEHISTKEMVGIGIVLGSIVLLVLYQ